MQSAAGVAGPLTNINKRIRFSQTITFEASGTVHVSQDVETPERVKEPDVISLTPGIQIINHDAERRSNRGGRRPNAGRKKTKKAKK